MLRAHCRCAVCHGSRIPLFEVYVSSGSRKTPPYKTRPLLNLSPKDATKVNCAARLRLIGSPTRGRRSRKHGLLT